MHAAYIYNMYINIYTRISNPLVKHLKNTDDRSTASACLIL